MNERSRRWCFTAYPESKNFKDIEAISIKNCKYIIWGEEHCPSTGNLHYQGYAEFGNAIRKNGAQKILGGNSHVEKAIADATKNIKYCSKEKKVFEQGVPKKQGRRSDLEKIKEQLDDGVCMNEIAKNNFSQWCIYRRAFDEYKNMGHRSWKTEIIVCENEDIPIGIPAVRFVNGYFIGYNSEEEIRINDWNEFDENEWKHMCANYPHIVNCKNGSKNWLVKTIYVLK